MIGVLYMDGLMSEGGTMIFESIDNADYIKLTYIKKQKVKDAIMQVRADWCYNDEEGNTIDDECCDVCDISLAILRKLGLDDEI